MSQAQSYNADLSYHFINLALVGEVQPIWEAEDGKNEHLDDLFSIPRDYYPQVFLASNTPTDDLYNDIHGYIWDHYEQIGAIRIGEVVVSDYEELDDNWSIADIDSIENMLKVMGSYSQRVTEQFSNIRYNFSRLLMGYALRARDDSHGIIVMRGTVTTDEWLNNINYRMVNFHPAESKYGRVHNGFRDIYKGVRGRYRELVEQFPVEQPLYLVGHSLGAAVSQLAALDIIARVPQRADQLRVYGYAPPRVGDATFAGCYNKLVKTGYRIVNVCDPVPYMPFEKMGELLDQQGYPYADTKGEIGFVHQAGNPIANHISSYHLATKAQIPAPIDASTPKRLP